MTKVNKVTAYKTSDDEIFTDKEDATAHQNQLNAEATLESDPAYCYGELHVTDIKDVTNFLNRNKEWILPMMGWYPEKGL